MTSFKRKIKTCFGTITLGELFKKKETNMNTNQPITEPIVEPVVEKERIAALALKMVRGDEELIVSCDFHKTHGFLMGKYGHDKEEEGYTITEGFVTDKERFVNRQEAWLIAKESDQLKYITEHRRTLFSYDLNGT